MIFLLPVFLPTFFGMTAPWKIQLKTEKYFYLQIHYLTMKIRMFHVENATFL